MIDNFIYQNPVKIIFGAHSISQIANEIPRDAKILITYGGGSIKHNGIYDQVMHALSEHTWFEFSGIEANPVYETLMKAVELVKKEQITYLLAVGGGSVIDGTKFIAAAAKFEDGDPWNICLKRPVLTQALPLGVILTLPATGSEMNINAVISRKSTQEKLAFASPLVYPQFSILDPLATYTLPKRQIINGIIDSFIHTTEQYLNEPQNAHLQDRQAESILNVLIDIAPSLLADEPDYESRASFMWTATNALNGSLACGVKGDWGVHAIGHELTAFYGLDHAQTLAIVLPSLLRHQYNTKKGKLAQMYLRVWEGRNLKQESCSCNSTDPEKWAQQAIHCIEQFFHSLGAKTKLSDYNIVPDIDALTERFEQRCPFGENKSIQVEDAIAIINAAR